ncbi:MAG: RDD family protein [Acidimicrobiales bacterium]|jgi:uncharacterized RDD family membrane protein YckC
MSTSGQTPPGWYHAEGDPTGTERFWNGSEWQGEPRGAEAASATSGVNLASVGQRIGARAIDWVILSIIVIVATIPFLDFDSGDSSFQVNAGGSAILVGFVISFLYEAVTVGTLGGTPGKLMLGLRVAEQAGETTPPAFGKAVMRWLPTALWYIPFFGIITGLVFFILNLVWLNTDSTRRTIYDRFATTYVVKA